MHETHKFISPWSMQVVQSIRWHELHGKGESAVIWHCEQLIDDGAVDKRVLDELSVRRVCRLVDNEWLFDKYPPNNIWTGYCCFEYCCDAAAELGRARFIGDLKTDWTSIIRYR